ncbi:nuclear receptor-binding protein [Sarotherodon galilaeus]
MTSQERERVSVSAGLHHFANCSTHPLCPQMVISRLKRNKKRTIPAPQTELKIYAVTSHNLQTENLKGSQPHFLNKAMSAAAVLPLSQGWGVNLHKNQLPDVALSKTVALRGLNEKRSQQMLLTKAMCEIFVILANGQRCLMLLRAVQLQVMIVSIFKEEVLKMVIKEAVVGYTKDNMKLHVDGMPLDDDSAPVTKYGIKTGSVVQMVIKVHGG